MQIEGKVEHSVYDGKVHFSFREYDKKASKDSEEDYFSYMSTELPFLIWQKFKNAKVKITIEKA